MSNKPLSVDDWDSHWRDSDAAASENPAQSYRHSLILKCLERAHLGEQGSRLIDFGSGQGDFLAKAVQEFPRCKFVGFELSEEGVRLTSEKAPNVRVLQLDLFNPTAEMNDFRSWATHGTCSEVLEHLDDPGKFIRAMNNCLAPQGYVVITVPSGPISAFDTRIGHRQHFTVEQLGTLIESNGLKLISMRRAGFPFHTLYRLLVIARGSHLADDVHDISGGSGRLAKLAMRIFGVLFRANLSNTRWGWQLIALAQRDDIRDEAAAKKEKIV